MSGAVEWILAACAAALSPHDIGPFDTAGGRIAMLDPLAFSAGFEDFAFKSPGNGGRIVVFEDVVERRNSKLAIIFADGEVSGGEDVSTMFVDAGMGSIFTSRTIVEFQDWLTRLGPNKDPYNDFFSRYDNDPAGLERKIVPLPTGTPVPYVHTGWGDGAYPVFTLTNEHGKMIAAYADFMGCEDSNWLTPPGVTLN